MTASSVSFSLSTAGVYRISAQAIDKKLNLSNRQSTVVRIGGAVGTPPIIGATFDKLSGSAPLTVNVDMSSSTDPDGVIQTYLISCYYATSGTLTAGPKGSCVYDKPGNYWIMLIILDNGNLIDMMSAYVTVLSAGTITPPPDTLAPTVPTNLTASAPDSTKVNLSWTASTDNIGVTGYKVFRNSVQIATVSTTSYTDTSVTPGTSYTYTVAAYDAAGNTSVQSTSVAVIVPNPVLDATPPTVAITSPTNGSTIANSITISVSASDNVKVTKVEIYIDGALKVTDTASPYTYKWNSRKATSGSHTISAKAYDAAGNIGTSSIIVNK
jgi:hypothetical protein